MRTKRTNYYIHVEEATKKAPKVMPKFNFLTQEDYDSLPILKNIDRHGRTIMSEEERKAKEHDDRQREIEEQTAKQQRIEDYKKKILADKEKKQHHEHSLVLIILIIKCIVFQTIFSIYY